jgi:cell shape-determining protein MreD
MKILNTIKNFFSQHLIVIVFYAISFSTFEGIKEFQDLLIFSFNLQMIIVYFYVLKFPENLGNGHIFMAGIVNDVVIGIPLGTSSLSFLVLTFFTTYIRNATLRSRMTSEWTTFIPALFFSNFVYFIVINNFSHLSFYYIELLSNTFFTFLFFPIFYFLFNNYEMKISRANA